MSRKRVHDIVQEETAKAAPEVKAAPRLRRNSPEVKAARVGSFLDNPETRTALDNVRVQIISELERLEFDGSEAKERQALELVRRLQTFIAFKRELVRPLAVQHAKAMRQPRA